MPDALASPAGIHMAGIPGKLINGKEILELNESPGQAFLQYWKGGRSRFDAIV